MGFFFVCLDKIQNLSSMPPHNAQLKKKESCNFHIICVCVCTSVHLCRIS